MATSPAKTTRLFYPTTWKHEVLEHVARHEVVTIGKLVSLIHGPIPDEKECHYAEDSIRRTVRGLVNSGHLHRTWFRPDDYKGTGKLPYAVWLSRDGAEWATANLSAALDPKPHAKDRSFMTIPHDLLRTETRAAIYELARARGWKLGWRKTDLFHLVKPDDFFELTPKDKTTHWFLEEENRKKSLEELHDKFEPYVRHQGSGEFKKLWGFRNYTVIVPMRDAEARDSAVTHFAGRCNCIDPKLRRPHSSAPFKLDSDILWFTTHQDITKNTAALIFLSPTDKKHSFLELIQ